MECPIKVNRHKGGKVDIYLCCSVGSSVLGGLGSNCLWRSMFFFFFHLLFYFGNSKEIIIFLQIHNLNLHKKENLSFDNILFENDWRVINKISLSDLTMWPQSGRGRWECLFRAFIIWRKVRIDCFFLMIACIRGKALLKVNLNGIRNDWNRISD